MIDFKAKTEEIIRKRKDKEQNQMAIVSANQQKRNTTETSEASRGGTGNNNNQGNKIEDKVVNLFTDKGLYTGEATVIDPTEDAWESSAPPPRNDYHLKLFMSKDFAILKTSDRDSTYQWYQCNVEGKIVNSEGGEFDGITVFAKFSTSIPRGKNISTVMGMFQKIGYKIPAEPVDHYQQALLLAKAIKKEPVLLALCDWNLWSTKDKRAIYKTMADFPVNDDGSFQHIIVRVAGDNTTEEIKAQLQVRHWYSKGEPSLLTPMDKAGAAKGIKLTPQSTGTGVGAVVQQVKTQTQAKGGTIAPVVQEPQPAQVQVQVEPDQANDDELILEDE